MILDITTNSLNQNFGECEEESKKEKHSRCYVMISSKIHSDLSEKLKGRWAVSVGDYIKFDLVTENQGYIEFFIGEISFDIEKLM
jgi:hypothetical protein